MHKPLRASMTGWLAAAALLMTSSQSAAVERLIVLRTYDNFGVAAAEILNARAAADAILKDAGLQVVWRDCSAGCPDVLGPGELVVRIVAAPEASVAGSLGCAVVDLHQGTGALATVYADRLNVLASRTGVDAGALLGRAIAHEVGHLLLGTARHSPTGLMRAHWSDRELQRDARSDWTFSQEDLVRIAGGAGFRPCRACPVIAQGSSAWQGEK
jgi:hypothetical protein